MSKTREILIANGVNLDLLGTREPEIYGKETLADVERELKQALPQLLVVADSAETKTHLSFFQSNDEAQYLEVLSSKNWDGMVLNPGAWTHTSLALADRLKGLGIPYVEVHLSNTAAREGFRQHSYLSAGALGKVQGFGLASYHAGLLGLLIQLKR